MKFNPSSFFFWNLIGTLGLGFSGFVPASNLSNIVIRTMRDLAEQEAIWKVLGNDSISLYGFILIILSGTTFILITKRVRTRGIIGTIQIMIIAAVIIALESIMTWLA